MMRGKSALDLDGGAAAAVVAAVTSANAAGRRLAHPSKPACVVVPFSPVDGIDIGGSRYHPQADFAPIVRLASETAKRAKAAARAGLRTG